LKKAQSTATTEGGALRDKEAELLSLRLKLENVERGAAEQRSMSTELAERYGKAQRELARAKASLEVLMGTGQL
jgi:hypothetical protein